MSGPGFETRELDAGIWLVEHPFEAMGIELGRRMTVVRLDGGRLWLHAPTRLTPELGTWLEERGRVALAVCPNPYHHRFVEAWFAAYPEAEILAAPGLPERRPELGFHGVLGDAPDPRWATELDQAAFRLGDRFTEIVFLHRASRALILTDLLFQIPAGRGLRTALAARILGYYGRPAVSRLVRWTLARDRDAARAALERVLAWDFDRIVLGHGEIVERDGRAALERAFDWL